jgi:hypothetical protein
MYGGLHDDGDGAAGLSQPYPEKIDLCDGWSQTLFT